MFLISLSIQLSRSLKGLLVGHDPQAGSAGFSVVWDCSCLLLPAYSFHSARLGAATCHVYESMILFKASLSVFWRANGPFDTAE